MFVRIKSLEARYYVNKLVIASVTFLLLSHISACSKASFTADSRGASKKGETTPNDSSTSPEVDNPTGSVVNVDSPNPKLNEPVDLSKNPPPSSDPNTLAKPGSNPTLVPKIAKVSCSAGTDASQATIDFSAPASDKISMQVDGEFCPQSTNQLSVVLILDFSASMGKHYFRDRNQVEDGSDPLTNGSCGRFNAVQNIVNRLVEVAKPGDNIQISMLPFAAASMPHLGIEFKSPAEFKAMATAEAICRYVSQGPQYDTPGSISNSEARTTSGTNYASALSSVRSILSSRSGQKLAYMITDGEPTIPESDPMNAGISASQSLRSSIQNLTLNTILLKSRNQGAIDLLTKISGSADRVKLAADSSQLASLILGFQPAAIDERFGSARIFVGPYEEKKLGLSSMTKKSDAVWNYITQPFILLGKKGEVVENRVSVYAKGVDGSIHSSIVTIRYTQE